MITSEDAQVIKETVDEFLSKMTIDNFSLHVNYSIVENKEANLSYDMVSLDITMQDPKFLIGQNGKTLLELERLIKMILNKKLSQSGDGQTSTGLGSKNFYLKLDINDYQKKKIEYLKNLAKESADEVALTKRNKVLPPMPPYERRIIHMELAQRQDIMTES